MSQVSDVSLANQGFSAFRSELNNILGAINTSHLGTSAPGSIAQGTIWLDTSSGATGWVLKLYDGAGHISLGTINSTANTVDWTDSTVTADIVGDTSPQLGGQLDVNGNALGDGTLEKLDKILYEDVPTVEWLTENGWKYSLEPNSCGDWAVTNQWLEKHPN